MILIDDSSFCDGDCCGKDGGMEERERNFFQMEDKIHWVKTHCGRLTEKNEHRTSNVQHRILQRRTSVEWEKMKKQTYDLEER